jgi:glycosyltransferase involved in cell wall biosynthesis
MATCQLSVVVSTYNRADRLPPALASLLCQTGDIAYEVIVVDNNSSDGTSDVIAGIAASDSRVRHVFEPRQGLSHGRNAGIARARASIVAFTDDDVRVAPDWVAQIRKTFDEHRDVGYVGGRVLPHWLRTPPAWLTTAHWAPLALQDYGDEEMVVGPDRAICLVGASLAFRRQVFDRVGLFAPALGRIKDGIGSTEDHDLQLRAWRAGLRGLYTPAIVSTADVTPDRMVKAYHRRWHRGHGRHCALMRLREYVPADLGPLSEPRDLVVLFGSPAFVYAELLRNARRWLGAAVRRADSMFYANQLRHVWSYVRTRYALFRAETRRSRTEEIVFFLRAYARKWAVRLRTRPARA